MFQQLRSSTALVVLVCLQLSSPLSVSAAPVYFQYGSTSQWGPPYWDRITSTCSDASLAVDLSSTNDTAAAYHTQSPVLLPAAFNRKAFGDVTAALIATPVGAAAADTESVQGFGGDFVQIFAQNVAAVAAATTRPATVAAAEAAVLIPEQLTMQVSHRAAKGVLYQIGGFGGAATYDATALLLTVTVGVAGVASAATSIDSDIVRPATTPASAPPGWTSSKLLNGETLTLSTVTIKRGVEHIGAGENWTVAAEKAAAGVVSSSSTSAASASLPTSTAAVPDYERVSSSTLELQMTLMRGTTPAAVVAQRFVVGAVTTSPLLRAAAAMRRRGVGLAAVQPSVIRWLSDIFDGTSSSSSTSTSPTVTSFTTNLVGAAAPANVGAGSFTARDFWVYNGTLSRPPCDTTVWFVQQQVWTATQADIDSFLDETLRPLQSNESSALTNASITDGIGRGASGTTAAADVVVAAPTPAAGAVNMFRGVATASVALTHVNAPQRLSVELGTGAAGTGSPSRILRATFDVDSEMEEIAEKYALLAVIWALSALCILAVLMLLYLGVVRLLYQSPERSEWLHPTTPKGLIGHGASWHDEDNTEDDEEEEEEWEEEEEGEEDDVAEDAPAPPQPNFN